MSEEMCFIFRNITVKVGEGRERFWQKENSEKTILNDVSGKIHGSSLVAIMGPSGSGKTTLLGALSGRISNKTGVLEMNGAIISDDYIKNISGYVQQQNIFTESLTALEYLRFMAAFQLPTKSKKEQHDEIRKTLTEFNLESLQDTLIRCLSGGEKRRLSLAGVILDNPVILFCDEPTTGLDSYSAMTIMKVFEKMAKSGNLILTTIHQPSSQIFSKFNNIVLLSNGELIFEGSRDEALVFFNNVNLRCPESYNPGDFYLKCITSSHIDEDRKIKKIARLFRKQQKLNYRGLNKFPDFQIRKKPQSFFYEMNWLIWRCFISNKRNLIHHFVGYVFLLVSAFFLAMCYVFVRLEDKNSAQNIQGCFLYLISEVIFTNMYAVIYVFPQELAVFLKEKTLYRSFSYFLSKLLAMIPLFILTSTGVLMMFFIFDNFLRGYQIFITMSYLLFCASMSGAALGLSFSAAFTSLQYVELILTSTEIVLMIMSGMWIKLDNLPTIIAWIKYLSPFYYTYETISNLYWRNIDEFGNCTRNETIYCFNTGDDVLNNYGFLKSYDIISYNFIYLHILTLFYCSIGFLGIVRKKMLYNVY